jgi:DNA ligase (NAD+)
MVDGARFESHGAFLKACRSFGLPVDGHTVYGQTFEGALAACLGFQKDRATFPFEADGAVVKVDNIDQQRRLGFTFKSPRWAVAYKFPAAQATTRVNEIELSVGRTGAITPVAKLEEGAKGDANLQELLQAAMKARATLGEASDRLRKVFGEYRENVG